MAAREPVQKALLLLGLLIGVQGRLPWHCCDSRSHVPHLEHPLVPLGRHRPADAVWQVDVVPWRKRKAPFFSLADVVPCAWVGVGNTGWVLALLTSEARASSRSAQAAERSTGGVASLSTLLLSENVLPSKLLLILSLFFFIF